MMEETILLTALEKIDPAEQQAYLDEACAGDPNLRRRLDELLQADGETTRNLAAPTPEPVLANPEDRPEPAPTCAEQPGAGLVPADLRFLTPSSEPGHLGRLDHYEVLEVIGRGGFGIVLRAWDEQLRRPVAIKVLAPQLAGNGTARKRFVREAQACGAVNDEHVVAIHSVHNAGTVPYLVMQYVAGISLQQKLDQHGPLELEEVLRIGAEVASGLAAAHTRGLVHRDVKPANILLEEGTESVKITDFGLARAADDASLTQSGVIAGTPLFMSPEQAQGETIDHRSDLFSLGSVLYMLCTGRPPFRARTTVAVLRRVCNDTPRPISEIAPEMPEWLCDLVNQLHAKRPENRFQSAAEVAELLANALTEVRLHDKIFAPDVQVTPTDESGHVQATDQVVAGPRYRKRLRWVALFLAVVAGLGILEMSGVTRFTGLMKTGEQAGSKNGPAIAGPAQEWVQLFNGQDLNAWEVAESGKWWKVEDGVLKGWGPRERSLLSKRKDYQNFHLRVEARISKRANSGVYFRGVPEPASGYEAQIYGGDVGDNPTGTLSVMGYWPVNGSTTLRFAQKVLARPPKALVPPDTWFVLEVIAQGSHFVVQVNGKVVADVRDRMFARGRLALESPAPVGVVYFRKIEIKELPGSPAPVPEQPVPNPLPNPALAQELLARRRMSNGDFAGSVAAWKEAIRLDPRGSLTLNNLAWVLATGPDEIRDGKQAIALATRACELTAWKQPVFLDTLAAAYAEVGKFDQAVEFQKKALAFPAFEKLYGSSVRKRLALYIQKKPYREPLPPTDARVLALLSGMAQPVDVQELIAVAREATHGKQEFLATTRLIAKALVEHPEWADQCPEDPPCWYGACCAAKAAHGAGIGGAELQAGQRRQLRAQALIWLQSELARQEKKLADGTAGTRLAVASFLQKWQTGLWLASVRTRAALAKLPKDQGKAFEALWAEVETLRKKATEP
jgi:serine/threonine protein kinase